MTPETRERLAVLVERRLAGLLGEAETAELAKLLNESGEAMELYLRAVEFHIDLGAAPVAAPRASATAPLPGPVHQPSGFAGKAVVESAGEKRFRGWATRFAVVQVAAGFLLVGLFFILWGLGDGDAPWSRNPLGPKDPAIENDPNISRGVKSAPNSPGDLSLPPRPPPPIPPLYNPNQVRELKHNILANVWLANMASVISECMRFRNLTNDWAQLQADVAIYEGRIKHDRGELSKVGEKLGLETYLQQGDQIIGFAQRDFTTMKPGEAAAVLNTWVNNWRSGTALEQVLISRAGGKMTLYLEFPEDTKELLNLVRHPSLQLEGAPGSGLVTEMVAIPAEVIQNVNTSFSALPPGYRSYLQPEERKKLETLTANKRGSSEDIEWLNHRILNEAIPAFQREAELIRSQVLALEPKLKENAATDVIIRKNGTKIQGQIVEETGTAVKIRTRFGTISIPVDEIAKIEMGKGSATEFPQRYADAKGNLEKLVPLLAWCAEKNLKLEKEYVAYTVLTMDASNEKARSAVGLSRPSMGAVIQPATAPKYPSGTESAKVQGVEKTIEIIANDVISRNQAFTDVVVEMRRRTEGLTTTALPVAPAKSIKGVAKIPNPLTFDPARMPVADAVEIGSWWSQMLPDERREFAKYYGLWCAFTRGNK